MESCTVHVHRSGAADPEPLQNADWRQREAVLQAQLAALQDRLLQSAPFTPSAAGISPVQPPPQPSQSTPAQQQPVSLPEAEVPLSGVTPAGTSVPPPTAESLENPPAPQPQPPELSPLPKDPAAELAAQLQSAVNSPDSTDVLRDESVNYLAAPYAARRPGASGSAPQPAQPSVRDLPPASAFSALESMLDPYLKSSQQQQQPAASAGAPTAAEQNGAGPAATPAVIPTSPPTLAVGADDLYWMAQLHKVSSAFVQHACTVHVHAWQSWCIKHMHDKLAL